MADRRPPRTRVLRDPADGAAAAAPLRLVTGPGSVRRLPALLRHWRPDRVAVVATDGTARRCDLAALLDGASFARFGAVTPNPTVEQVLALARFLDRVRPQVVVAVGGGSVIDAAKAGRLVPRDRAAAVAALGGRCAPPGEAPPLVAVPTVAGSGSEVTRFATVYVDGRKYSLDGPRVRPEAAVVDPELTAGCPPSVTYPAAFDALAHSVESYGSVRGTPRSRRLAGAALRELVAVTAEPLAAPTPGQRARLARAATVAGRAIDASRTTAAHAFSYRLTAHHGIPHGLACLLNLIWLLPLQHRLLAGHCRHPEGPAVLRRRLVTVYRTLTAPDPAGGDADGAAEALRGMLRRAGLPWRWRDHGLARADLPALADAGLGASGRVDNNPVALDRRSVLDALVGQY